MPDAEQIRFLGYLDADPRAAEKKYSLLRSKLVFYFRHHGGADPDDLADEVFARVLRRISEGAEPYSGISPYCFGIAQNMLREERRRVKTEELPPDLPEKDSPSPGALNRPGCAMPASVAKTYSAGAGQEPRTSFPVQTPGGVFSQGSEAELH